MNEESQNILSISLGTDSFKYAVYDESKQVVSDSDVWKTDVSLSLTANLRSFFKENEELCDYQKLIVRLESRRYITVPIKLFDEKQPELYYYQNIGRRDNETILYNAIQGTGILIVYGIDTNAYHLLSAQFPNVSVVSHVSPLISSFAEKSQQGGNNKMYVNLSSDFVDVIGFNHGKLLIANSYACRETSDRLYYIMYAWVQIGLDQNNDEICFLGHASDRSQLLETIGKYIRHRVTLSAEEEEEINHLLK